MRQTLQAADQYIKAILRSVSDALLVVDEEGIILTTNQAAQRLLGHSEIELIGEELSLVLPAGERMDVNALLERTKASPDGKMEQTLVTKDSREVPVLFSVSPVVDLASGAQVFVCVAANITRFTDERSRALHALQESQERYALAVRGANDGLWDWKPEKAELYLSARWKEILGYADEELPNQLDEWFARVHPDDLAKLKSELAAHLKGASEHFENEHRILHKDGTYRWVLSRGLAIRDSSGQVSRMAGSQSDVTQSRSRDPLTGLPNRVLYIDRLERALQRAARDHAYRFGILFLDLDRFKIVNDSLGHLAGDALLVSTAQTLTRCLRSVDTIARLGGDEFTIMLDDIHSIDDAISVANRIQRELSRPVVLAGREIFTSASIGIAIADHSYSTPADILRDADVAMYRAKAGGKARYAVFDSGQHLAALSTLELDAELRRALDLEELAVFYQPIVCLKTKRLRGFEALVRWKHHTRGTIPPSEFIPIAEETGFIVQIDRWVFRTACVRLKKWLDEYPQVGPVFLSLNVSKRQFERSDLAREIEQTLASIGLPPQLIHLEVTESVVMHNADHVEAILTELRNLGIHIDMDDFGTGYSSLSYLHRFPFTGLKIDRSFVSGIDGPKNTSEIVRAIATLADGLRLQVTAEGVETEAQREKLVQLGCARAQGYLFARPMDEGAASKLLRDLT